MPSPAKPSSQTTVPIKRERSPDNEDFRHVRVSPIGNIPSHSVPVRRSLPAPDAECRFPHADVPITVVASELNKVPFDRSMFNVVQNHSAHLRQQQNRIKELEATVKHLINTLSPPVSFGASSNPSTLSTPPSDRMPTGGANTASPRAATDTLDDKSTELVNDIRRSWAELMRRVQAQESNAPAFLGKVSGLTLASNKSIAEDSVAMCSENWPDYKVIVNPRFQSKNAQWNQEDLSRLATNRGPPASNQPSIPETPSAALSSELSILNPP
jgi:hypothetical protein